MTYSNPRPDAITPGSLLPVPSPVYLQGIGTAVPRHQATQEQACAFFERVLEARSGHDDSFPRQRALMRRVYSRSGIATRRVVVPDFVASSPVDHVFFPRNRQLDPTPGTAARMHVYERESVPLAEEAARRGLQNAGVDPSAVTHLIICTCTGFFAPGLDVLLCRQLGFSPSVSRTILGFMGCYAGLSGMRTAEQIVRGDQHAVVLQVCVELCSLHFSSDFSPDAIVSAALFADGAAAAVYSGIAHGAGAGPAPHLARARILATRNTISPDSLDAMSWRIGDHGFEMRLDAGVPDVLQKEALHFVADLARSAGLSREQISGWAIHPGGRRIVEALQEALTLTEADVESSLSILRDYGNMSSATVLFVLEQELARADRPSGPIAALAFGPGLTVEGVVLEKLPGTA